MDADLVIAGAGSAGWLLADRLAADPALTVTLIAAGARADIGARASPRAMRG